MSVIHVHGSLLRCALWDMIIGFATQETPEDLFKQAEREHRNLPEVLASIEFLHTRCLTVLPV